MKCPKCGNEVDISMGMKFCPKCGERLVQDEISHRGRFSLTSK